MGTLVACLLVAGCGGRGKKNETASGANEPSTAQTAINGFTGKTAVDAGQKAKADIQRVSAQRNKEMQEVLDEN
jgi:outer membrane murein-binding lipoprotein Lpp